MTARSWPSRVLQTSPRPVRVLVTGGAGFIGRTLVSRLVQHGCDVSVLDDLSTGVRDRTLTDPRVRFRRGSVLDLTTLREVAQSADLVFHLAGVVGKALAVERAHDAYHVAVDGTAHVLSAAGDCPVVLFSSSAVYGTASTGAVAEDADVDESCALSYDGGVRGYAVGKLHMEVLGREAVRRGRPVLVVRPFNVVGPGQTGRYGMVLPRFIACANAGRPLQVYGDGKQTRSFGHVRTFVDTLLTLVDNPDAWRLSAPFVNLGTSRQTSILSLAQQVLSVTKSASRIEHVPYESVFPGHRDVLQRTPDTTLCVRLVGPVQWPSVRTIVRDALNTASTSPSGPPLKNDIEQRAL